MICGPVSASCDGTVKGRRLARSGQRGILRAGETSWGDNPKTNEHLTSASVQPLLNSFTGPQLRQTVYAMLGAVLLVLVIACVNVMNMYWAAPQLRAKERLHSRRAW